MTGCAQVQDNGASRRATSDVRAGQSEPATASPEATAPPSAVATAPAPASSSTAQAQAPQVADEGRGEAQVQSDESQEGSPEEAAPSAQAMAAAPQDESSEQDDTSGRAAEPQRAASSPSASASNEQSTSTPSRAAKLHTKDLTKAAPSSPASPSVSPLPSSKSSATSGSGLRAADYVNVRSEPSTASARVGMLEPGQSVTITGSSENGFQEIVYQGKSRWVASKYLTTSKVSTPTKETSPKPEPKSASRTVYASADVNVRVGASVDSRSLGVVARGTSLSSAGAAAGGWTPVTYQGKSGWVKSSYVSTSKPAPAPAPKPVSRMVFATTGVNVRAGGSSGSRSLGVLSRGDHVGVRGAAVDGWVPVSYKGQSGWVKSSYVSTSKPKTTSPSSPSGSSGTPSSYSAVPNRGGVDPWGFYWGQCTSYAAWRVRTTTNWTNFQNFMKGVHFGNAENWGPAARQLGISVNTTPTVGSIAWSTAGSAGHVAYVTAVHSDGTIDVAEYNFRVRESYGTRSHVSWRSGGSGGFTGFIHF